MKTIIDTATDAGKFTTLLNALKAAALTETLRGAGPYTVFARRMKRSNISRRARSMRS